MRLLRNSGLQLLKSWIDLVQAYRIIVVLAIFLLAGVALLYTIENISMNSGTKNMLSEDLPWRQRDLDYERHFPQYVDNILVVVEAGTPDQAMDGARAVYRKLRQEDGLFHDVFYPNSLPVIRQSALLYLNTGELQDLADNLAAIQPFLTRLTEDQTLRGLFGMLSEATDAMEDGEELDIDPLLEDLSRAVQAVQEGRDYRVSWQHLMRGQQEQKDLYREYVVVQPALDYSNLFPAGRSIDRIRTLSQQAGLDGIGARVRLTGGAVLSHEELKSVTRGTGLAFSMALVVVTLFMLVGLGSVRLVMVSLVTLLIGLIFTATFATAAIGELNLISVAFAVLYIGLGVDFAIHFCLRYRELLANEVGQHDAIDETSLNIGRSLFLCAMTTAIGFFAFIPTDYDGVAELGLISGVGMFISLATTLTLLPALLSLIPVKQPVRRHSPALSLPIRFGAFPITHARTVRRVSLVVGLVAVAISTQVRFDYNPLNLQNAEDESVITFKSLLSDPDTSPWRGIIVADGRADASRTASELEQLDVVDDVIWLEDFIPENQEQKLAIIEEMNLLLFGLPGPEQKSPPISTEEQYTVVRDFNARLARSPLLDSHPAMAELHRQLSQYDAALATMPPRVRTRSLAAFSDSVLASLPGRIETLRASLQAAPLTAADLPPVLARRWHSAGDGYLLEITPAENLHSNSAVRHFVKRIRVLDPRLIGAPVVNLEASDAVISAFQQAFLYALVVITLFLLLVLEHKRDTLYILLPMLMAAALTASVTVLFNMPFNFANVIALPLLLGIGVDSGIHILHRFRTALPLHNNILATSTARAVVVSSLTTMGGIGNLAFSEHTGTASMGKLLSIGIAFTLACMLILLPSMLAGKSEE